MPNSLTSEQVLALAPDTSSAQAARGLAVPHQWVSLNHMSQAVWGECRGSGAAPYQVLAAPDGRASRCTCPSRKRPCKHALALLLLAAAEPPPLISAAPPEWVRAWLAERARHEPAAVSTPKPAPDPEAQARRAAARAAEREAKVAAGVEELRLWLADLVRRGLAAAQGQPPRFWDGMAARLVDAQAPGLARRVRELGGLAASGAGWPERLTDRLGRLHLLLEAYGRVTDLSPDLQADVRAAVGWTVSQEALLAEAGARDEWQVLGRRVEADDQLRTQRTWLWGRATGQAALVLTFAAQGQPLEVNFAPGTALAGEVVFFPSALPQRGLLKPGAALRAFGAWPGYASLAEAARAYGRALARQPWLERTLAPLWAVTPVRVEGAWWLRDVAGHGWPLAAGFEAAWQLLGLSGGAPLPVCGEWDGEAFWPLSAWAEDHLVVLGAA
ncbi:MAG: SWIM zinc finger family protein [Anaerolineales bacterium]|nr:SWIM zinc finger family protein [Anaerolineales bacterium]